jgi:hypothetical protein
LSRDDHRRRHGFIACDRAADRVPIADRKLVDHGQLLAEILRRLPSD